MDSIHVLQNKAAKLVLDRATHFSTQALLDLNWMKLSTRRLKQLCCFMHNFINDSERNSMSTRGSDYHSHNTRCLIMLLEFHYLDIIKLIKFA